MSKISDKQEGASLLRALIDWDGKEVAVFTALLLFVLAYLAWKKLTAKSPSRPLPYKVVKPPATVIADLDKKKRICAVIGGTGFLGSSVVDELVRRGDYYVYVLGRTFRPERTNPDADCLIQVDLLDFDGLVSALQGVDSVIDTSSILPNVFTSADEVQQKNENGQENVLRAAKKTGVKSLVFISGMVISPNLKPKNEVVKAFIETLYQCRQMFLKESGIGGLYTCAICPGNIVGLNSPYIDPLVSGQVTSMPMSDHLPTSYAPVEYVARAIVNAERKLAAGDEGVGGKAFKLRGEVMTSRQFCSLPGWPKKITQTPLWMMNVIVKINKLCATLFGKAPFGADLSPALMEMLTFVEDSVDESEIQHTYDILEVGPPKPPMEEYVRELVERYQQREKLMKEKQKDK